VVGSAIKCGVPPEMKTMSKDREPKPLSNESVDLHGFDPFDPNGNGSMWKRKAKRIKKVRCKAESLAKKAAASSEIK
jgi:hypothetical protein